MIRLTLSCSGWDGMVGMMDGFDKAWKDDKTWNMVKFYITIMQETMERLNSEVKLMTG